MELIFVLKIIFKLVDKLGFCREIPNMYLALVLINEKETFGRNFNTVSCVFKVKLSNFCHRACPSTHRQIASDDFR